MLSKVDKRIAEVVKKKAGEKLEQVLKRAEELVSEGKQPGRALADALEQYNLK